MAISQNKRLWLLETIPKKKCRYCFSKVNLTYDHMTPIILGGKTVRGNIQVLCRRCNGIKSGLSHGTILYLARWINEINIERNKLGKRHLGVRKQKHPIGQIK